ncbi:MAG: carbon-nitrogen hydrolase family protein [Methanomassiliicoccaceae archaeon]|nr:carbon-nitrogen hydrolase family protein [Methanomassiliicoccaceae archaeon]
MKIAIAQVRGQIDDPPANASKAKMLLGNVDADLFIFPEMFAVGYDANCARFVDGSDQIMMNKMEMFMNKLNTQIAARGCCALFGAPVFENGKLYDAAVLSDGKEKQVYKKIHLNANDKFSEKDVFAAGNEPKIFDCKGMRIGVAMGNDLMFNEMFRWYALKGVDIVVCISAVPQKTLSRYEKIIPARCIENSIDIVYVNMVGPDPGFVMAGGSRYVTSDGTVVECCPDSSDVRQIKLNDDALKASKEGRAFLKDIRNDIGWS